MGMRRWTAALMTVALLGACEATTITSDPDDAGDVQVDEETQKKTAELGDSITLAGFEDSLQIQVTVLEVVDPAKATDQFTKPEKGSRFVSVRVSLRNVGTDAYSDSPSNGATLIDTENQAFTATFIDAAKPGLGSAKIAPGDERVGYITFEVLKDAEIRTFQFTLESGMGPETGEWSI